MDTIGNPVKEKPNTLPILLIVCIIMLISGSVVSVFLLLGNYRKLGVELKVERTVYINEISSQISDAVYNRRDRLLEQIAGSASALDFSDAASYEDVRLLFKDKLDSEYTIVLCDDKGKCFDVYGNPVPIQNNQRLSQTLNSEEPSYFFEKSTNGIDYWVFASRLEPKHFNDHTFVMILELYNIQQFQSVLSLDLFEDEGMALIVNNDGTVNLSPANHNLKIGYNVIHSFEELGMPKEKADAIKQDMAAHRNNRLYTDFLNTDWLIDYKNIAGSDEYVLVLVPIAVTSAGVTQSLQGTMLGVSGLISCIALLVLVFVFQGTQTAKRRNRQLYELQLRTKVVETKNDFLAKMSHDIRTPLNAIIGMNFIASTQVEKDSPIMDSLKKTETAAKYLLSILNDILDMSKIESGKMEIRQVKFSMSELLLSINSIVDIQAKEKGISFVFEIDRNLSPFYIGDSLRINQILMNLISNALKFTPKGGHILTEVKALEKNGEEENIRFVVSDDGIGMSEEFLLHIFDPFTQDGGEIAAQYGGSGLGLAIVKSLVEQMHGHIEVTSKKNEGSTFAITLPLKAALKGPDETAQETAPAGEEYLAGIKILLVEDNELNRMIAKEVLQMFGTEVDEAADGKAALELFLDKPEGYYAAVITDIRMPVMNGHELADRIRHSRHPDAAAIPILAMSANAFDDDVEESRSHGMNAHLKKPIDVNELKKALCTYARLRKEPEHEI